MSRTDCDICDEFEAERTRYIEKLEKENKRLKSQLENAKNILEAWLNEAGRGKHVCSDTGSLESVVQALKGE